MNENELKELGIEIQTRESWRHGDELAVEIVAYQNGVKLFSPGAQVICDRKYGSKELTVTVGWSSSDSSRTVLSAKVQLAVMARAVELAESLAK